MKPVVYNEGGRLNKIYMHMGQMLLNTFSKLSDDFPSQIANYMYPPTVILPVCSFPFITHLTYSSRCFTLSYSVMSIV